MNNETIRRLVTRLVKSVTKRPAKRTELSEAFHELFSVFKR